MEFTIIMTGVTPADIHLQADACGDAFFGEGNYWVKVHPGTGAFLVLTDGASRIVNTRFESATFDVSIGLNPE